MSGGSTPAASKDWAPRASPTTRWTASAGSSCATPRATPSGIFAPRVRPHDGRAGLGHLRAGAVVPVSDLATSRSFYEDVLGLRSLASFQSDDLAATVGDLERRGVQLAIMGEGDPYETDERGIADLGDLRIAWFRDPDGQVISVFESS
jgi:hypothetical protein